MKRLTILAALLTISGCGATGSDGGCPDNIPAMAASSGSGIQWGGTSPTLSANITAVKVECLPEQHVAIRRGNAEREAFTDFEIAATAWIQYEIKDTKAFESANRYLGYRSTVIFEAVSSSSVVLGSAQGTFQPIGGGSAATVSAKITGLSRAEIHRVARVVARWKYD